MLIKSKERKHATLDTKEHNLQATSSINKHPTRISDSAPPLPPFSPNSLFPGVNNDTYV